MSYASVYGNLIIFLRDELTVGGVSWRSGGGRYILMTTPVRPCFKVIVHEDLCLIFKCSRQDDKYCTVHTCTMYRLSCAVPEEA
jgi:hypothetical protein